MSLGQSNGSVVFGRPLDLTVPVRLDAPMQEPANCFSAEVFQGDRKFDSSRVRVDVKVTANPLEALVRIHSTTSITEPWAKVILRANCDAKMSRQYDFLTDLVTDALSNSPNSRLPVIASAAVATQEAPAAKTLPPQKLQSTAKLSPQTAKSAGSTSEGKSRLKMETFELLDEQQVMLKMSTSLLSPASSDSPANAQAIAQAAAIWRALNAKPEEVVAAAQKLQTTATELQSVKDSALKTRTSLQERLRSAEAKEFFNPVVYGLLGLLALTLAGLVWLLFNIRKGTQPSYAWLRDKSAPLYAEPQIVEPLVPYTSPTESAPTAQDDEQRYRIKEMPLAETDVPAWPAMPATPPAPVASVHPKPTVSVSNNPLWLANVPSSTQTVSPAALVITPTETLNIDLDFAKIAPSVPKASDSDKKNDLIDFELLANPPAAPTSSQLTG